MEAFHLRGRRPVEAHLPRLLDDIGAIVDGQSQTDPQFRNQRLYTRLSVEEVHRQLIAQKGYTSQSCPKHETLRLRLNALGYYPQRVAKTRPKKILPRPTSSSTTARVVNANHQSHKEMQGPDVILVWVSRSRKTPTSLYLAIQYGLKASNYPLIPGDFERPKLPPALVAHRKNIYGLTIAPDRLSEICNERQHNPRYASLDNCRMEVSEAEGMMRREGIRWLSTTTQSIEEIATTIPQEIRPERLVY
ncbi:FIG137360: hypothetical protein [Polaromonas sp. CG9_12]|nr:FIG137360: hypothetical protein [Polaromonas sp. CG9_12]